jgi:hypothetical protein
MKEFVFDMKDGSKCGSCVAIIDYLWASPCLFGSEVTETIRMEHCFRALKFGAWNV